MTKKSQKKLTKKPKVSIIIPFFRHMECAKSPKFPYFEYAKPIKGCIESVRNQTYKNKEIIFADTRSSRGSGVVRNRAIEKTKGDIIFFVCPDAILVGRNVISDLVKIFEKNGTDIIVGSAKASKKMRLFIYLLNLEYEKRTCDMGEKFTNIGATTYLAVKKDILKKIDGIPINSPVVKTDNPFFNSGFLDWDLAILFKNYKYFHTNKLKVHHHYQTDFWSYFKKQFWQGWYRIGFGKKFGSFS
jgi:glycosyltransferase involved in cell wall biosynthesis